MPSDVTIFAAKYLIVIEALLAAALLAARLPRRPRATWVHWVTATGLMLILAYAFKLAGAAAYTDPRPFVTDHIRPLLAHAPDNGFPSDHALLAAALVAAVAFAAPLLALPVAILAVLVDCARVGAGLHHVTDVVGSTLFVALAASIALVLAPGVSRILTPYLPAWLAPPTTPAGRKRTRPRISRP